MAEFAFIVSKWQYMGSATIRFVFVYLAPVFSKLTLD